MSVELTCHNSTWLLAGLALLKDLLKPLTQGEMRAAPSGQGDLPASLLLLAGKPVTPLIPGCVE